MKPQKQISEVPTMAYSLEDYCREGREILTAQNDHTGRDKMRTNLERLLADEGFKAEYLQPSDESGLQQIYQDEEVDFCVLIYNMDEARKSPPHDHGRSWAIYGQALEYTDMTEWRRVDSSDGDGSAKLEEVQTYRLDPGKAGLYDVGDIHSIDYPIGAKFVRVTGKDMSTEARLVFDPDADTAKKVEHVGTGNG
jgi:hypothetical protein